MRSALRTGCAAAALTAVLLAPLLAGGCSPPGPVVVSREVLGTAITITAYGGDAAALRATAEAAFADMTAVEAQLDPYDATSTIGAFNAAPREWHALPPDAIAVLDRVDSLGVRGQFSPALFGVTRLYDFGGRGSVPTTAALATEVAAARGFERDGSRARFADRTSFTAGPGAYVTHVPWGRPGLDFGGASKGLAVDRAMTRMRTASGVAGVMVSAGSSTQVWGRKPDGRPWRVGVEDPRDTGRVVAIVGAAGAGPVNVSTSGDYQLFFERAGVRYHHILDPSTGRPARGLRSLTVFGAMSALDADILSTALFVMGPTAAKEWAERNRVGLYAVDDRGRVIAVSAPKGAGITFERIASPKR